MPKRVKYRKTQRGSRKGNASRTISIDFGEFALQTLERAWITNTQIEAHTNTVKVITAAHFFVFMRRERTDCR